MYDIQELWDELKMAVNEQHKPTELQQSIYDFGQQYDGIVKLQDVYMDYTETVKCSRDYFFEIMSTKWSVFKEDNIIWIDFDAPFGDGSWTLESSSVSS